MLAKKCPKCGAVWYTALTKCAFCGIEGEEQPTSTHTGRLPEKPVPAAEPEPEKSADAVAVAEATPVPLTSADASVKEVDERPSSEPAVESKLEPPAVPSASTPPALEPLLEKRPDP